MAKIDSNLLVFIQKLDAENTLRSALHVLIDKEIIAENEDGYSVYDRFFGLQLRK